MNEARKTTLSILLVAFGIAVLRSPLLLLHGRVFAEEGTVYFKQAWDGGAFDALLALHQGYYSVFLNGLTLLAEKTLPLEWLGIALVWASMFILMLTVYLAATCEAFGDTRSRWLASGVVMFTPAIEVWLTAEDMQFYLPVCAALVFLSNENRHRLIRSLTLALAGLTGPCSCVLAPFFVWRAYRRRTFWAAAQAAITILCGVVEGLALLFSLHTGLRALNTVEKVKWFGPIMFMKLFAVTFFGRLGAFLCQRIVMHHGNLLVCLLFWVLATVSFLVFWSMAKKGGESGRLCFLMAVASLVFNYVGIVAPLYTLYTGNFRYMFSGFELLWLVPVLAYAKMERAGDYADRKLMLNFCLLILAWGAIDSVGYWTRFQKRTPEWKTEVAAWRHDPSRTLHVSPVDPSWVWQMSLSPH